jgi:hypothetical protein
MELNNPAQQKDSKVSRYSVIGGVFSAVLVATSYWETASVVCLAPIFFVTLVLGYVTKSRSIYMHEVGARAGLIGGVPVLWGSYDLALSIVGFSNPTWFTAVSFALLAGFVILTFGLTALLGELGGRTGCWLAERRGSGTHGTHSHQ